MKASDGSSDESEIESENGNEFSSTGFLKSLGNNSNLSSHSRGFDSIFRSLREEASFDSSIHDIFSPPTDIPNE